MKTHLVALLGASLTALLLGAAGRPLSAGQCADFSKDPAGCQPSTFDTPGPFRMLSNSANGMNFDPMGRLIVCEQQSRSVTGQHPRMSGRF